MRQVVHGPQGERYEVAARPADEKLASVAAETIGRELVGAEFLPDGAGGPWEVQVRLLGGTPGAGAGRGRPQVFAAGDEVIAERLVIQLGEELQLGVLEL